VISHAAIQLALRAKAVTLSVCTTGSISLSATTTGYARPNGSFVTDGFAVGMEVTPSGFATNTVDVITAVDALTMTTKNARAAEVQAAGRTILVTLPSRRAWENLALTTVVPMVPYVEEQYVPGPSVVDTVGASALITAEPLYVLNLFLVPNTDLLAARRYGDALLSLFAPRTTIALSSGDVLRVRDDTNPVLGQLRQLTSGFAVMPLSVPLRCFTTNAI
jgi:hypothetical protein